MIMCTPQKNDNTYFHILDLHGQTLYCTYSFKSGFAFSPKIILLALLKMCSTHSWNCIAHPSKTVLHTIIKWCCTSKIMLHTLQNWCCSHYENDSARTPKNMLLALLKLCSTHSWNCIADPSKTVLHTIIKWYCTHFQNYVACTPKLMLLALWKWFCTYS